MSKNILVSVDGTTADDRAIKYALDNFPDANITTIHTIDTTKFVYDVGGGGLAPIGMWCDELLRRADIIHESAQTLADSYGVQLNSVTRIGRPASEILKYTEEEDIEHIVVGESDSMGIRHIIFGSTAQTVTRSAAVPVTVTPQV